MKILYVVLDGLGDLPCPELDGKTPLEAAKTPHLDSLVKSGKTGLLYPVGKEIAPESDVAVISLLGYNAAKYYTGRGPLESYAAGLKVNDGDLAYRVNFATVNEIGEIVDRRVGRDLTFNEATSLAKSVNEKVKLEFYPATFEFKPTVGHRGVLVLRSFGGKLSAAVSNTDPAYGKKGSFGIALEEFENRPLSCKPLEDSKGAEVSATLTNEFLEKSHQVLEEDIVNKERKAQGKLKANYILARDGGASLPKFPPMGKRGNLKWGSFVEMPVEQGIAMLTGMEVIKLPPPTSNLHSDYGLRAEKVSQTLKDFDALYIHLKGPDEPAHDGKPFEKSKIIEAIDQFFFGELLPKLKLKEIILAVTGDHATPCGLKAHSKDPVPLLVSGDKITSDRSKFFNEEAASLGSLGLIPGPKLLPLLLSFNK